MENHLPEQNKYTLVFEDKTLEDEFRKSYDESVKIPLRYGIIISIASWFSAVGLIYFVIPDKFYWLTPLTLIYIGSYFGFIVYATFKKRFQGYYHFLGAVSNAWAGLFAIYFCDQFPNGEHLTLPVLIFIIFFGSYMIRLRWLAGFIAALTYTIGFHVYIAQYSELNESQVLFYAFVGWMTLIFTILAGRVAETNNRIAFANRRTIREQNVIIEREKELLLKEVHHRVKNNLQLIVSLINLQLWKIEDQKTVTHLRETQSRVLSMSLVHQRMNQTSDLEKITISDYVKQLIENSAQLHQVEPLNFDLQIPSDATLDIDTAIPVGLIINEMITNFINHCEPDDSAKKHFTMKLVKTNDTSYFMRYEDNGKGFPEGVAIENCTTLGLELIQTLTDQLNGELKIHNDKGAVYEIRFEQPV